MSAYYVVWKAYQRRAETFAPRLGARLLYMPHAFRNKWLRPLDYLKNFLFTFRILLADRPKFVFIQSPPLYAALAPLILRIPYVIDGHNAVWQTFWGRLPLSGIILRNASALIVHNDEIRKLAEQRLPGSVLITIRDPIDAIRWPVPREPNRVLFVCSFDEGEPVGILPGIVESLPEYDFYITADPLKLPRDIRAELKSLPNLTFTGFLPTEEYQKLMRSSAVAVVLEEHESTQPSGACEAMASETPLVLSRSTLTSALFGDWACLVNHRSHEIAAAIREAATPHRLELSGYRERWNAEVDVAIGQLVDHCFESRDVSSPKAAKEAAGSPLR
jgi:glycosyltransferase involved in cell wall biosynthesis